MNRRIAVSHIGKVYTGDPFEYVVGGLRRLFDRSVDETGSRRQKAALHDVTFTIEQGERVGIIGANGAGKSTLLQILSGVAHATSGSVLVEGRVHAVLTLGLGLREELTGRENLYLEGEIQGKTREELDTVIEEMIAYAELGEFIDQPVRVYSTGMKARLSFANLVFVDPDILLIDEALGVGDYQFALKSSRTIKSLCAKGNIVVIISHSRDAIIDLCTRCLWLDKGRLIADGDPTEVTQAYAEFVRRQDEERIATTFASRVNALSFDGMTTIDQVAFRQNGDATSRTLLNIGKPVVIDIKITLAQVFNAFDVRLFIERWDGLIVSENWLSEGVVVPSTRVGRAAIEVMLPEFNLRPSLYTVHIELFVEGTLVASSSSLIKGVAEDISRGGEPVLRGAMQITSRRISLPTT